MKRFTDLPLERSDDLRRGTQPHLAKTIAAVRGLSSAVCYRCRRAATHLIDTTQAPRAVCTSCEREWRGMTPAKRDDARSDFQRRGIQ